MWWVAVSATSGMANADRPGRGGGLGSMRQRAMEVMRRFLARPDAAILLPGLTEAISAAEARLTTAWPDLPPMPLYPAFGGPPAPTRADA